MKRDVDDQLAILTRSAVEVVPIDELKAKLAQGRPLRVKHGVDPTAPHVHLGWSVPLRKLRAFQELGHIAVLVVGDFTARIGDPSGQDKTRPMLSKEQVDAYASEVLGQIKRILLPERLEIRPNSEWLEALGTQGVLELASENTVARTLERDDFAERLASGTAITVREFLYPLLQSYDSVAVQADIEIGGTDQHYTFMLARHIQRAYDQEPQVVMTFPLLEGTDGVRKMSQSLGNYIAITEQPDDMFGKLMRVPDELMGKYLRLVSDLTEADIERLERELPPQQLKRALAHQVVRMYHSEGSAKDAAQRFDRLFVSRQMAPEDIDRVAWEDIPEQLVRDGLIHIPLLLKWLDLANSSAEARRLLSQGGFRVNDVVVRDLDVPEESLRGAVIQVGKHRFKHLAT